MARNVYYTVGAQKSFARKNSCYDKKDPLQVFTPSILLEFTFMDIMDLLPPTVNGSQYVIVIKDWRFNLGERYHSHREHPWTEQTSFPITGSPHTASLSICSLTTGPVCQWMLFHGTNASWSRAFDRDGIPPEGKITERMLKRNNCYALTLLRLGTTRPLLTNEIRKTALDLPQQFASTKILLRYQELHDRVSHAP